MPGRSNESFLRREHQGVTYFISIARLHDGRWDAWVHFADAGSNVLGHDVGIYDDWDAAHERW